MGEIIGLRWEDLDFDGNTISINHNLTYYPRSEKDFKCEFAVSLPKTEKGVRTIPMLDKVRDAFAAEKEYQETTGSHCVMEVDGMFGFIFCNRFGNFQQVMGRKDIQTTSGIYTETPEARRQEVFKELNQCH